MRPSLSDDDVAGFRAAVLRVAQGLFARHGTDGVTMRQIASELGVSPTTAYRYFQNKEEILAAVRASAFNAFCEVIEAAAASSPDPRRSARVVGDAYLEFAIRHPDAYRMMFDVNQAALSNSRELTEALERAKTCMVTYVEPLVERGFLHGEVRALGQMLWAAAHGLVMLRLSGVIAEDAELRSLHEKTMSSIVRGANQVARAPKEKGLALVRTAGAKTRNR